MIRKYKYKHFVWDLCYEEWEFIFHFKKLLLVFFDMKPPTDT